MSSYVHSVMRGNMPATLPAKKSDDERLPNFEGRKKMAFKMRAWGNANYIDDMLNYLSHIDRPVSEAIRWRSYPPPFMTANMRDGYLNYCSGAYRAVFRGDPREENIALVRRIAQCEVDDWERYGDHPVGREERNQYIEKISSLETKLHEFDKRLDSLIYEMKAKESALKLYQKQRDELRVKLKTLSSEKTQSKLDKIAQEMARIIINQEQNAGMYDEKTRKAARAVLDQYCKLNG